MLITGIDFTLDLYQILSQPDKIWKVNRHYGHVSADSSFLSSSWTFAETLDSIPLKKMIFMTVEVCIMITKYKIFPFDNIRKIKYYTKRKWLAGILSDFNPSGVPVSDLRHKFGLFVK